MKNLRLVELTLSNFLSHASTQVSFNGRERISLDGFSGAGKSSLIDGIVWAIYGKGRTDNRSLIRKGCDKASVELMLSDGHSTYRITRECTREGRSNLSVLRGDGEEEKEIPITGIKQVQAWVEEELIGSSYGLFVNSVVSIQGTPNAFSSMSPSERKDLLTELADTESMEETLKSTKMLLTAKTTEETKLSAEVTMKETIVAEKTPLAYSLQSVMSEQLGMQSKKMELEAEVMELRRKIEADAGTRKEIAGYASKIALLSEKKSGTIRRITALLKEEGDLTAIDASMLELGYKEAQEISKRLIEAEPLEKECTGIRIEMAMLDKNPPRTTDSTLEIAGTKEAINKTGDEDLFCTFAGTACPKLVTERDARLKFLAERLVKAESAQAEHEKTQAEYIGKKVELTEREMAVDDKLKELNVSALRSRLAELSSMEIGYQVAMEKLKRLPVIELEKETLSKELENIGAEITAEEEQKAIRELWVSNEDFSAVLREKESGLSVVSSSLLSIAQRYSLAKSALDEVTKYTVEVADTKTLLVGLRYDIECLKLVKDAFGSNGIKSIVCDVMIPELERRTNAILEKFGDFRVELDTQQDTVAGDGKKEGLFISILNPEGERMDYDSYSGGEKVKISMALFEGLAAVSNCDFRIYDESVVALDADSLNAFSQALMSIKDSVRQIVCISHLSDVKELMERNITVVKSDGVSSLV